jgi:hypothetical protein
VWEGGGVLRDSGVEVLGQRGGEGGEEGVFFGVAGNRGGGEVGSRNWEGNVEGRVKEVGWWFRFRLWLLGRRLLLLGGRLRCL